MASLPSPDQVISEILAKFEDGQLAESAENYLRNAVRRHEVPSSEKIESATRWMSWARQHPLLKVVSAPVPIPLGKGYVATMHDVKVFGKRWQPDDAIYEAHKELRDKVARGNSFLELKNGPERGFSCVIYAMKKFTGGLGDDDDREKGDNLAWKQYFTKPLEDAVTLVCTRKANGEAAHFSARLIANEIILCGGSKNVHMLFRNRADIERYTDSRFNVARDVCMAILDLLELTMSDDDRNRLLQFLCLTEYTAVLEIECPSHQHVEDFSHLKCSQMKFITWTSTNLETPPESQLCSLPPHIGIEIARALGFLTVDYEVLPVSQVESRMMQVRRGHGYEGEVLYFLDANNSVIGLLKKKTIWYILCRAVREKARAACQANLKASRTFCPTNAIHKVEKRLEEIQSWLGLDDGTVRDWKKLGGTFVRWCIHRMDAGEMSFNQIADKFPVVWKRYLVDTDQSDRVNAVWTEPSGSDD